MRTIGNLEVLGNRSIIKINPNITNNYQYSGIITTELVGVNVRPSKCLYFDYTNLYWKLANANSSNTMPCRGIALETKNSGEYCKILRFGTLRSDGWNLNTNMIYVSDSIDGEIVITPPTTSGSFVQIIGTPTSLNTGFFDFNSIFIQLA